MSGNVCRFIQVFVEDVAVVVCRYSNMLCFNVLYREVCIGGICM